ncbi:MAG: TonB-dependent receptor, partial [Bacteroidales bacterium]|nr:TonB-dependent receptor [Bacteroidales bacterium]
KKMTFRKIMMAGNMAILSLLSGLAMGQENPQSDDSLANVELREIKVLSSRVPLTSAQTPQQVTIISGDDIKALPVNTLDDLLKFAVGIDVRQKGNGVASDLSIHGGSFDQVTVLMNGINITSAHTGHVSCDYPLSADDIERIEVLEGPSARVFGTTALTGTINIVTKDQDPFGTGTKVKGLVNAFGGDHGYVGANARVSLSHNAGYGSNGNHARMIHNISGGYVTDDGDTPNSSYYIERMNYHAGYRANNVKGNFQAGYSYKAFDANTFFGAASTDQWESDEHLIIAADGDFTIGNVHVTPIFAADRRYDHYQWHKDNPAGENFHRTDHRNTGISVWADNVIGRTAFTAEMRNECIYSTNIGEKLTEDEYIDTKGHDAQGDKKYDKRADRTLITIMAEQDIIFDKWTIALAVPAISVSSLEPKWRFCPGMDVSFRPSNNWKIFANVNSALRMPTYTDLYYTGKNIVGTRNLDPERTVDYGMGAKMRYNGFQSEVRAYGSHRTDMIDWVIKATEEDGETFRACNFEMNNFGLEVSMAFLPREIWTNNPVRKFQIQYAYNDADMEYAEKIIKSKYAMEYLKNKLVASTDIRIVEGLTFSASYRYCDRMGDANEPYSIVDAGLNYDINRFTVYANCNNVFDEQYCDFSFIPQSGRRFFIGAKVRF